jgi:hypothetical protein
MIIGISGKAGSGKDTVGDYLLRSNLVQAKIPLAQSLKYLCSFLFNIPIEDMYENKEKETQIKVTNWLFNNSQLEKDRVGTNLTVRELLQYFGTDIMRSFYSNVWTDVFLKSCSEYDNVVCTDVRFIDEVEAIQKSGGIVIRLTRNTSDMSHSSEKVLDDYKNFDIVYNNIGETPEKTCKNIRTILEEL